MSIRPEGETVLVTGGSGYLGAWMIVALLQRGYRVRTTLRNLTRKDAVSAAIASQVSAVDKLSFFAADLLNDDGWHDAVKGCDYVIHVASPMGQGEPKADLVSPARDGALRVLKAAVENGVGRVVLTSSTAAATPRARQTTHTKTDERAWTDPAQKGLGEYFKSKTLAERAAWKYIESAPGKTALTTILPGLILGPAMAKSVKGSVELVLRMLTGKFPALPRIGFSIVDVRDVADLHLRAMVSPQAAGQRFLATTDFLWMSEIANLLRQHLGPQAAKVPQRALPDFLLRLTGLFSAEARFMAPMIGQKREYDTAKAATVLDWHPRSASQAIVECAHSLIRQGFASV